MTISNETKRVEEMQAEIERLRAELEATKAAATAPRPSMKVSEKGAVSVYGLGRFPVTLYPEQWQRLIAMADEIQSFIKANSAKLKWKIPIS